MTTVDEARRRSTDEILGQAMEDSRNGDGKKVSEGGRPLHFDSLGGLAMHRAANRPTDYDAGKSLADAGMGKLAGASVDALVDKAVSGMASAGARGFAGASWQITSIGALAYHLYTEGYEKPHREKDRQLALGASDAGVVGLAQALPFDASFKRAVTTSHPGAANAAAGVAAQLSKPEHSAEVAELTLRADRGLVDAAPLARSAAHDIAQNIKGAASYLEHAKDARTRGDLTSAANFEKRAESAMVHAADLETNALAPLLVRAHADAAYGLGVQNAMHHALRVELGKEDASSFAASVARACAELTAVEPSTVRVQG